MFEEEKSPAEKIKEIENRLKGKRSLRILRVIVSETLRCKPDDLKEFRHQINKHSFRGVVYLKRNSLMGSVFGFWDNKPFVLRAYPKIKYSDDSRVYNKECITQNKYDGTNLCIFKLPDGTIMPKTRMLERADKQELFKKKGQGITYLSMLKKVNNGLTWKCIGHLLEDYPDFTLFGELYGSSNPGDFIKYTVEIDYKIFDIIDRKTQRFLPPEKVYEICEAYGIPHVEETWKGILTDKQIQRIEFELEREVRDNGFEGFVAKAYIPEENDCCFAKLKCEKVKEKCWNKDKKPTIPMSILRKAVRKVLENFPDCKTMETIEPHVIEELKEEVEDNLIEMSMDRIRSQIRWTLTPSDEDLFKLVIEKMQEMKARGIDLNNKGHVLSNLASALGTIGGGKLYTLYNQALREME